MGCQAKNHQHYAQIELSTLGSANTSHEIVGYKCKAKLHLPNDAPSNRILASRILANPARRPRLAITILMMEIY